MIEEERLKLKAFISTVFAADQDYPISNFNRPILILDKFHEDNLMNNESGLH